MVSVSSADALSVTHHETKESELWISNMTSTSDVMATIYNHQSIICLLGNCYYDDNDDDDDDDDDNDDNLQPVYHLPSR